MAGVGTSTLTIAGGVRENALTGAAAAPNFTTITLQNTTADPRARTYPQGILGLPGVLQPVQFTFERFVRQLFVDDLASISVHVFAAPPRSARGGSVSDAVAQNSTAQLCEFTYTVRSGLDGSTNTEAFWCVFQLVSVQRTGQQERGSILAYPCNVLRFAHSTDYQADPDTTF